MFDLDPWIPSPPKIELAENEIHIWRAHLDGQQTPLGRLAATLTSEEKERAKRYFFERDRTRFVVSRGILRELLGRYLSCTPREIEFEYSSQGKPSLRRQGSGRPIRFNISHSHGLGLFAFALGRNLGVDVELVRPDFGAEEIAARYFAPQEIAELRILSPSLRADGFFLCWTRKEAYIKARGEGLQIPLDSFYVSLTPGQKEQLHSADAMRWRMQSLRPDQGYVGALVGEGQGWSPRYWGWSPLKDEQP
jgi:4'-phosphopantetheinyl transferase